MLLFPVIGDGGVIYHEYSVKEMDVLEVGI